MSVTALDAQKGKVAREGLLGRLLWFSVPEATLLDQTTLVQALQKSGLNRTLPGFPADHDVYRRVTTAAERRRVPHDGQPNQFENWLVRDVASRGEDVITRRIVCEVVDPKGRRLAYTQVADIEFIRPISIPDLTPIFNEKIAAIDEKIAKVPAAHRARKAQLEESRRLAVRKRDAAPKAYRRNSRLRFVWLDGANEISYPTAKDIMGEVGVQFSKWKGKVHDATIRVWIRKTIMDMGATPCRSSGGIYFLEEAYADQVEALEKFCADVLPPGGECHSVEIPNSDKQVEMVRRSIEAETIGAIERLMVEIAEIRKAGRISSDKYVEKLQEVAAMKTKISGYSELLERDLSALSSRLELLGMQARLLAPLQRTRREK